jgi:hypothetical protein
MTTRMLIAPLAFVSVGMLLVYTQPHIPCIVMALAKLTA